MLLLLPCCRLWGQGAQGLASVLWGRPFLPHASLSCPGLLSAASDVLRSSPLASLPSFPGLCVQMHGGRGGQTLAGEALRQVAIHPSKSSWESSRVRRH